STTLSRSGARSAPGSPEPAGWARQLVWGCSRSCPSLWSVPVPAGLDIPALLGEPTARRDTGEVAELAHQVRLVEIAALVGDLRERLLLPGAHPGGDLARGKLEPHQAADPLRAQPELVGEQRAQLAGTERHVLGQCADRAGTVAAGEPPPRLDELGAHLRPATGTAARGSGGGALA